MLAVLAILTVVIVSQMHRLDQWRGLVRDSDVATQLHSLNEETKSRQQEIDRLKASLTERDQALAQVEAELATVRATRPTRVVVEQRLLHATVTDDGLLAETQRLLPGLAVRLLDACR